MNIIEKASLLFDQTYGHTVNATGIKQDGKKVKLRLFKKDNIICYFKKNSCKYGYRLEDYGNRLEDNCNLTDIFPITHHKSINQKWEDGWKKVKTKLEASGLWENVIKEIDIVLDIGYEKMQLLYEKYWNIEDKNKQIEYIKQVDKRLIGLNDKGEEYIITNLIWSYAGLSQVKKMYFGKYENNNVLEKIQNAMQNKIKISEHGRASYDVSFEYNPEHNRAWYSEEYKGCGNGHYYIALNNTHALFSEND